MRFTDWLLVNEWAPALAGVHPADRLDTRGEPEGPEPPETVEQLGHHPADAGHPAEPTPDATT